MTSTANVARDARHPRDLLGERAVERLHDRVEQRLVGIGGGDRGLDLRIDPIDDVEREQAFDDHRAVPFDCRRDGVGIGCCGESFEGGAHSDQAMPALTLGVVDGR